MVAGKTIVAVAAVPTPRDPTRLAPQSPVLTKRKSNLQLLKEEPITLVVAEVAADADVDHVEEAMTTTATRVATMKVLEETVAVVATPVAITTIATVAAVEVEAMADVEAVVAVVARTTPEAELPKTPTSTIPSATTRASRAPLS